MIPRRHWSLRVQREHVVQRVVELYRTIFLLLLVPSIIGGGVLGCGSDTTTNPPSDHATQAYWTLRLNVHAVNLALTAPYDTVRLMATPLTLGGTPVADVGLPRFQAIDSTVTVNSTGLVTAHVATSGGPTRVTVSVTAQGVTLTDTAFIQVTQTPPLFPLATFSVQSAAGDSAKMSIDDINNYIGLVMAVTATDANRDTVCNSSACTLQIEYTSSNPLVATIDRGTGEVTAVDTGHVVFTATTLAYGVEKRDSVGFTVGYRLHLIERIGFDLGMPIVFQVPTQVVLGIGAIVTFFDQSPRPLSIRFSNPAHVDSATCDNNDGSLPERGDIAVFGGDTVNNEGIFSSAPINIRCRRFPVTGTYQYYSPQIPGDTLEFIVRPQH